MDGEHLLGLEFRIDNAVKMIQKLKRQNSEFKKQFEVLKMENQVLLEKNEQSALKMRTLLEKLNVAENKK